MERHEKGKSPCLRNTNRKSEIDGSVPNSGLQPPFCQAAPAPSWPLPAPAVCLLSACRKEFLNKGRSLAGEERAGILGDFYVWQRYIENFKICISDLLEKSCIPHMISPSPFCSFLSVLLHHNFLILFLLIFFL